MAAGAAVDDENRMKKTAAAAVGEQCPLLEPSPTTQRAGGFTTLPFIAGNLALTMMVNCGISPNMILYVMREYGVNMTSGSNIIYWWGAFSNVTPILAALMADSFMGRLHMITLGSILNLLGISMLWLTTMMPQLRPPHCTQSKLSNNNTLCTSATPLQLLVLLISLALISVGSGGVRSSSLAFGIDQLKNVEKKSGSAMESYFGCYYAINMVSVLVSITCLVYIQENMGWEIGFGVLVVLMLFATACILLGYPFYVKPKPKGSLITGLFQVVVACYRKRSVTVSSRDDKGVVEAYHQQGPSLRHPSETLRFLNKACIIEDPQKDLNSDGKAINPWSLCTLEQVEELKACLKVLPIWATGVIMNINVSQGSFSILQATTMDRHVGPRTGGFEIPAASLSIFTYISVIAWLALYERVIRRRFRFTATARMGCGIFVSLLAVAVAAVVEGIRRARATSEGLSDNPEGVVGMSVLWVVPHTLLTGLAEGMNAVAQNEFYVSEFPPSMWSIASNFLGVGMAGASMAASVLMSAVAAATRGWEGGSWISSNINKGHYDYYNWVLVGLSLINLMLFFFVSRAYGPYGEEKKIKQSYVVED